MGENSQTLNVLLKCNEKQQYAKNQKSINRRIEKQYGKTATSKLQQIQAHLKQDLRIETQRLRKRKLIRERRYINRMFKMAPKKVYCSFKGEGTKSAKEIPTKEETTNFWSNLWEIPIQHKEDTPWMKTLKEEYCKITDEVLEKVLKRLANDKPGRDLVAGL